MLVLIESDSGHRTLHKQAVSHNMCSVLLDRLRKTSVVLTLRDPYAKGRVVEAHCVLPDGSILHWPTSAGGSLAMLTAIRRASSLVSNFAADLRPGRSSK
jgi:hypothetical protein